MTTAACQSLGISDDTKERLNRVIIAVATMEAGCCGGAELLAGVGVARWKHGQP